MFFSVDLNFTKIITRKNINVRVYLHVYRVNHTKCYYKQLFHKLLGVAMIFVFRYFKVHCDLLYDIHMWYHCQAPKGDTTQHSFKWNGI